MYIHHAAGHKRRAATVVVVAVTVPILVGFAALTVDVGYLFNVRADLQKSADAAAHAGATLLPDEQAARDAAHQFAVTNFPGSGTVLADTDLQLGNWDSELGVFTANGQPRNAIRVTTRRSAANGNPVDLFFASMFGIHQTDVSASATAMVEFPNNPACFDRGIVAGKQVNLGQDVTLDGYCAYGREGVQMGQDPHVINGAMIGVLDESTVQYGQDPVGLPENIVELEKEPVLATNVSQIINDLEAGIDLPPQINNVVVSNDLPSTLQPGTAYVINANSTLNIEQDYHVQDVIIAVRGNISWRQDGAIRNTGDPAVNAGIGLLATQDIVIGQDAIVEGVNIISGKSVTIGQDIRSLDATIQAVENVIIGQDMHFDSDFANAFAGTNVFVGGSGQAASPVLLVQ